MSKSLAVWFCLWLVVFTRPASGEARLDFNRDIRPILSDKCYACHGPDAGRRQAGLRLDRPEEPLQKLASGKTAIVPKQPDHSELVRRITTTEVDDKMPPPESKPLTKTEIAMLIRWIRQGATWGGHWAYQPPQRPALPRIKNKKWVRNAVDHFIAARLEKEGLRPSREADKERLIRRVTLDLTGLPPTLAEMDAFLADKNSDAYEKLVERLLASPALGERLAQVWLDLARYADTNGYHIDNHRDMWLWREWVIHAFNQNMPFDQFTIEQLAGDLLPNATVPQKIASGFNRNNMVNFEGGADPEEYLTKYIVDRVNTTATVWLGSTLACAECHDHKYDPFTQKEFYQLYALFHNVPENGLDGRNENPVPSLKVPSPEQALRREKLTNEIAVAEKHLETKMTEINAAWDLAQAKWEADFQTSAFSGWTSLTGGQVTAASGAILTRQDDFTFLVSGTNAATDVYELTLKTPLTNITGLRLEALADTNTLSQKPGRATNGNFVLTTLEVEAKNPDPQDKGAKPEPVVLGVWHSVGPFKFGSVLQAFSRAMIDEKQKKIDLTRTYEEGKLQWIAHPEWKDGVVQTLEGGDFAGTYLHRTLTVQSARQVLIAVGSDDSIKVWLNGKAVHAHDATRGAEQERDSVILWLEPGENHLLMKIVNRSGGFAYFFEAEQDPPDKFPVLFTGAVASFSQPGFEVSRALDKDAKTGWGILGAPEPNPLAIFLASQAFGFPSGTILKVRLKFASDLPQHALSHFRLAAATAETWTELGGFPASIQATLFTAEKKRSAAKSRELKKHFRLTMIPEMEKLDTDLRAKKEALTKLDAEIPSTMVMQEMEKPRETFVLVRGDFQSKGEKVTPGVPQVLFKPTAEVEGMRPPRALQDAPRVQLKGRPGTRSARVFSASAVFREGAENRDWSGRGPQSLGEMPTNRLQFAQWLVSTNHPLTARVTVNRFWQMFFGTGLVKSANDFGSQGEWPSHPELLDWLATEFMANRWNMKRLLKEIVLSATYRQDSRVSPQQRERDPDNRWLARGPRFRMEGEMIRDQALAASGLLQTKIGGESVRPYQPPGLWEAVSFGVGFSSQSYTQSQGDDLYRRGLYIYVKRSLPYPSLTTFDAPNREVCTVTRPRTTTPLQALVLLNDPVFVEAARALAQRILREGGPEMSARLTLAFRLTLARRPDQSERELLEKVYHQQLENFQKDKAAAKALLNVGESAWLESLDISELAAWTAIGNILLNLDETITKG